MRNEILLGARLAKSFAGETTFAAMFIAQRGDDDGELGERDEPRATSSLATSSTGSQMASPKICALTRS